MAQSVQLLRKRLKKQRAALSKRQQHTLSTQAVDLLQRSKAFRTARNIAIYLPVRGETDPVGLKRFANPRQQFYLPVLSPYKPHGLVFVRWDKHTRFKNNRFNIPEPLIQHSKMKSARQLDLVVMPLLGFDHSGSRLGMGGGFYDRSFAFKKRLRHSARPCLTGIAYEFQRVEQLVRQDWDIPLDAICTEANITDFRRQNQPA